MTQVMTKVGAVCTAALCTTVVDGYARAESHGSVIVETVNSYSSCFGAGTNLSNSNSSGTAFWNEINLIDGCGYSLLHHYTDTSVYDTDFLDPDISGANSNDDDTDNFDESGLAISFFQGHGIALTKASPDQTCTGMTNCNNPPAGTTVGRSGYGTCAISPASVSTYGTGKGVCTYSSSPQLAVCGAVDHNSHQASLSPYMALGENPTNGSWRGAGTNGGTSLAIVHMSFGMWTFFPLKEWTSLFAGTHFYAGIMISWGDTNDSSTFGGAVGATYVANTSSSVASDYANSISSVTDGGGCSGTFNGGINGCGCQVAMTMNSNNTTTTLNENWCALENDDSSQGGTAYWYYRAGCNYNTTTYPWSGGDN